MEIFKIRNKQGLYWEGHGRNNFTKKGKFWKAKNHVTSAINNALVILYGNGEFKQYKDKSGFMLPEYLKDCEIVKFELKEMETIKIE